MLNIYKTVDAALIEVDIIEPGTWINLIDPTDDEIRGLCEVTGVSKDLIRATLDEDERPHIEYEDEINQTLVIVDIPRVEKEGKQFVYSTIPFGVIHCKEYIITVCLIESSLVSDLVDGKIKHLETAYKSRFIFQLLFQNAIRYLSYLRHIDDSGDRIHAEMQKSYRNKELFQMMALEKSLVYFSTSLRSNEVVLEKLLRLDYIKKYPDDEEILEDVIIENKQAIEMSSIYRDIFSGMMDAYASIISNNLNMVMKFLASVTIVLSVPTIVGSWWGMNVPVPFAGTAFGFPVVVGISLVATVVAIYILLKKKMF